MMINELRILVKSEALNKNGAVFFAIMREKRDIYIYISLVNFQLPLVFASAQEAWQEAGGFKLLRRRQARN